MHLILVVLHFMLRGFNPFYVPSPVEVSEGRVIIASSNEEVYRAIKILEPSDTLYLAKGNYRDINLIIDRSGKQGKPILIRAKEPGKVFFTGNVKVELRGEHLILEGIYFKDGTRDPKRWKSHGPGLVAIYGSYNRITQCAFDAFDEANSAYITTSLTEDGKVPLYCRIDHCSFINKNTFDQVINLNNTFKATKNGPGGPPMYHRIDHCFFSNPVKPGNAGGGIRVGYYRNDTGRCVFDSNLFMRQDSEPEIITSKSRENIYYANTFLNCRGTLNFRHGDRQVAINNFFLSTDSKFEYGGMFIWGSGHVVANNYFNLRKTIASRGSAAVYLNPGPEASEHALAFEILIINNFFKNVNGYAINFIPLAGRRRQFSRQNNLLFQTPHNITLEGNVFFSDQKSNYPFFNADSSDPHNTWKGNLAYGKLLGIDPQPGLSTTPFKIINSQEDCFNPCLSIDYQPSKVNNISPILGIDLSINDLISKGIRGRPITTDEVGPIWLKELPGHYALTGKLSPEVQRKLNRVLQSNKD